MWLRDNAHSYGFIIRYPKDKTEITGYQYEPWHLRYVGTALAGALHDSNMTLDEIVPLLQSTHDDLVKNGVISE
jgi:D-alanyl-D-alanine carboxypeptidase